jgi:HemY protein
LALLVVYLVLRIVIRLVGGFSRGGSDIRQWQQNRRARNAQQRTLRGLVLAGEGDWAGAQKALSVVAAQSDMPLVNYLVAARAATELGDTAARDTLLDRAVASTPDAALAIAITRAELQMTTAQYAEAIATLEKAEAFAAGNTRVLELLTACHEKQQNWSAMLERTQQLEQRKALPAEELLDIQRRGWLGYFGGQSEGIDAHMQSLWNKANKALHRDPELVLAQVDSQIAAGDNDAAEAALRKAISDVWNDALVARYGRLRSSHLDRQLSAAEGWLKGHPQNPVLLLALGRLAQLNADQAKAHQYLEASVALGPSAEACSEMGRLWMATGDIARGAALLERAATINRQLVELA